MTESKRTTCRPMIVGLGEILWDIFPDGRRLGGAPANFAYHGQAMGAAATVVSAVGRDDLGAEIRKHLTGQGIDTRFLAETADYPTGTVTVELSGKGIPCFTIHAPVAWDFIPWTEDLQTLAASCDAVCFGSLAQRNPVSRDTIQAFLQATRADCLRVFDVNLRQDFATPDIVDQSLAASTVCKLNEEELPQVRKMVGMSREDDQDKASRSLMEHYGLSHVVLTLGPAGSVIYSRDDRSFCISPDVPVVDTVGAGDSLNAATVMGLLRREPLRELHWRASCLSAYVCSQKGATPPHPATDVASLYS